MIRWLALYILIPISMIIGRLEAQTQHHYEMTAEEYIEQHQLYVPEALESLMEDLRPYMVQVFDENKVALVYYVTAENQENIKQGKWENVKVAARAAFCLGNHTRDDKCLALEKNENNKWIRIYERPKDREKPRGTPA